MDMKIVKDLGVFKQVPAPASFRPDVAFFTNEKNEDWYQLHGHRPIQKGTVTLALEGDRVVLANPDQSMINPQGLRVVVVESKAKPESMVNKLLQDGELVDPPKEPAQISKESILSRMTDEEFEDLDDVMEATMPRRQLALFRAVQVISEDSELYALVEEHVRMVLGAKRADEILKGE